MFEDCTKLKISESKPPLTNIFLLYVYFVIGCFFISKKIKQKILPDSTILQLASPYFHKQWLVQLFNDETLLITFLLKYNDFSMITEFGFENISVWLLYICSTTYIYYIPNKVVLT